MIVLDASVVIALLRSEDAHHRDALDLVRSIGDQALGIAPLTRAEVLVGPARAGREEEVDGVLDALGLVTVTPPDDGSLRLARLRAGTGAKLPDCAVLLAAVQANGSLATFDQRLAAAARRLDVPIALSPARPRRT
jgi:predicted nucleic acid-binding protein